MQYELALFCGVDGDLGDLFLGFRWSAVIRLTSKWKVVQHVLLITTEIYRVE